MSTASLIGAFEEVTRDLVFYTCSCFGLGLGLDLFYCTDVFVATGFFVGFIEAFLSIGASSDSFIDMLSSSVLSVAFLLVTGVTTFDRDLVLGRLTAF